MRFIHPALFILLLMYACGHTPNTTAKIPVDTVANEQKPETGSTPVAGSLPAFLLPNLDYKTVTMAVYPDTMMNIEKSNMGDGKYRYDTLIRGKIKNTAEYDGEEAYYAMNPLITVEYTENDTTKAAVFFEGTFMHQHGHSWQDVQVFFFMIQKNETWLFLDSLAIDEFDVDEVEQINFCKKGFTVQVKSRWDNMGAFSERVFLWSFQQQKLVNPLYFWTLSGRMGMEEPYETEEQKAELVIKNKTGSEWPTVYYYSEKYGCSQEDAEDDLGFCSQKLVYEKGKYRIYPLPENARP